MWRDWNDWIDNPELGKIAFQFGTRPLLTQESPIPPEWVAAGIGAIYPDSAGPLSTRSRLGARN